MAVPATINTVLLLIGLLLIKHMFADFFLQTPKMLSGRGEYWHMGRAQHAGVHVLGSIIAFVIIGAPVLFTVLIVAIEWVIHFNIDFFKGKYNDAKDLNPSQSLFWFAFGVDQALHQLTYVAMVWAWVVFAF